MIDELEEIAIDVNGTLRPGGYNVMAGGESNRRAGPGDRKREEEATLPKYVTALWRGKVFRGYQVDHPAQFVSFFSNRDTKEEKLQLALEALRDIEAGKTVEITSKRRKRPRDDGLPKGVTLTSKEGYVACRRINGTEYRRAFISQKHSMDEKFQAAKAFLVDIAKTLGVEAITDEHDQIRGVSRTAYEGYVAKGHDRVLKTFTSMRMSMEEKLDAATKYVLSKADAHV